MKFILKHIITGLSFLVLTLKIAFSQPAPQNNNLSANNSLREHLLMDFGWKFAFGHAFDPKKDFNNGTGYFSYYTKTGYGDGPASKNFDDRSWRILDLPHDWAVELPFSPNAGYSHGYKIVGRNFPETSIGWYRKTFFIPESDLGRQITIEFDGVHRDSKIWINGFYLGEEHSGYYNFQYDLSEYLNYGGDNVIAVRVDATMEEGWYYEGAGIYRHVWLTKTAPLCIAPYGIFITSELKDNIAEITARSTVKNHENAKAVFDIVEIINDANGKQIATGSLKHITLESGEEKECFNKITVTSPNLWSVESPYLHKLVTIIKRGDKIADQVETTFGIRIVRFDAKEGFFLNGKHLLLKGTNNHQDHAGVGTAIPDALQEFRVKSLKEMGSNAIRCSHNPPTPELLDACDRLGMLVLDENRLMGINTEHLDLLKDLIKRDRNHPCVFIWSLGNEEWAIESNILGARIASTMQAFVHRLDSSRKVTTAISGGCGNGTSSVLDVMGFNYLHQCNIDEYHSKFPNQPGLGTEETTTRGTRGIYITDSVKGYMMATDRLPSGTSIEEGYKFYAERPFLAGLFFWTGFDYRGEPHPYGWPQVASQSGIIDLCGFPKDPFYYLKSVWTYEPVLHLLPHWNWKGKEGKPIKVWAFTNCDEVELYLNNKSLGRKLLPKDSHIEWTVNYEPGTLLAKGFKNGKEIIIEKLETTDVPSDIQLKPDRTEIKADGEDVSVIAINVYDPKGQFIPDADNEISFTLEGPGEIIGIGNGDPSSHEPDRYIEKVNQVFIENLKAQIVQRKIDYNEVNPDFNDSDWPSALDEQGNYNVKLKDTSKIAIIRGSFSLPELSGNTEVSIFPKSMGEIQAVYVNGHLIANNIKRFDDVKEFKLDQAIIYKGKNIYAIVGIPQKPRYQWDDLNADPGIIKVSEPAGKWKRKLFNGLAQVIVQSSKQAGEITLTATSENLKSESVKIFSKAVVLRPAVK